MSHAALYLVAVTELKKFIEVKGKNGIDCFTLKFLNILDFFQRKEILHHIFLFFLKIICSSMFYILRGVQVFISVHICQNSENEHKIFAFDCMQIL